jgi:hypothetical protein
MFRPIHKIKTFVNDLAEERGVVGWDEWAHQWPLQCNWKGDEVQKFCMKHIYKLDMTAKKLNYYVNNS